MTNVYATGTGEYVVVDGMIVEKDALRVAEAIKDYDPNLEILCVDPNHAEGISEEPFVIAEKCSDGILRPIFRCWELNDFVLTRIRMSDSQNRITPIDTIEQWEKEVKKANKRRYEEFRAEAKDIVAHIAGMKSKYTVRDSNTGELITFYDDRPAERK